MQDIKIPKVVTLPIFITVGAAGWNFNDVRLHAWDPIEHSDSPEEYVLILATEVTLIIPQDIDVRGQLLGSLEKTKTKIMAENHKKLKHVQDKIDDLLAIEYRQVEE